ncbi:GNAT family N-acetyltransferase [Enterobacter cloacae]|uniref:GNAT family N-acetyltransferase n=1 Tax=Enterobacteriaceae TaxID=543 RepID=UPI00188B1ED6|nr:GNAT family N-acetyltransferase [Enterobacter cloacae]MBF4110508.1 GNAT family N-acetyltransferase [Enterobacter cloacae]HDX9112736.1 GNAT family N-acetyltransferase [Klebsiella michiganensis]
MYQYSCMLSAPQKRSLLNVYNAQHNSVLEQSELEQLIDSAISLSNADSSFPLVVSQHGEVKACCLVHFSHQEKIRALGCFSFSILITNGDISALEFLFSAIFIEAENRSFVQNEDAIVYGPVHNSILINRGCRTFTGAPFTYKMPDNVPTICDWIMAAGGHKAKDLLEIVYDYDVRDSLLTHADERLLKRMQEVDFLFVQKDQIAAECKELAEVYNTAWQDNWGFSATTADEIVVASNNVPNIMGMIARRNGNIIGFTMMQFIADASGKIGRAFLSGVLPEYRQRGLSVVLTSKLSAIAIEKGIKKFSISWMLEDNNMIVKTMQKFTQHGKSHLRHYRVFAIAEKTT